MPTEQYCTSGSCAWVGHVGERTVMFKPEFEFRDRKLYHYGHFLPIKVVWTGHEKIKWADRKYRWQAPHYSVPTVGIYGFHILILINSDYLYLQHKLCLRIM
jgi:hypothetical protein